MQNYKKIIPCLDIKNARVVKGVNFVGLKDAGDPVEIAKAYSLAGADEITFLDISATEEDRGLLFELIRSVASAISVPLTVGGGIASLEDAQNIIKAGASKISINSSAVKNPDLINEVASQLGSRKLVVAIDIKKVGDRYKVFVKGGKEDSGKEAISWAKEVESRGAGEILLTSMDKDGVKDGYDLDSLRLISSAVSIPVTASGGAGDMQHILDGLNAGASSALAASIFHFGEVKIGDLKKFLADHGVKVKL